MKIQAIYTIRCSADAGDQGTEEEKIMKMFWIGGDGTGKTYGVYHGTSMWSKDVVRVAEGIKTFRQAENELRKLELRKNEQTRRNRQNSNEPRL